MKQIPQALWPYLTPTDGSAWQQYLNVEQPGQDSIVRLLSRDIRLGIKKWAVCALLCPSDIGDSWYDNEFDLRRQFTARPYGFSYMPCARNSRYWITTDGTYTRLPQEVLEFVGVAVGVFSEVVRLNPGEFHWGRDVLWFYAQMQLYLLHLLPPEKQGFVFKDFMANLKFIYNAHVGYALFRQLLIQVGIDNKWRRQADNYLRLLVEREAPNSGTDSSLHAYAAAVLPKYTPAADQALLKEQVGFLLRQAKGRKRGELIPIGRIKATWELFQDPADRQTKLDFIELVLNDREVNPRDADDLETWRIMLDYLANGPEVLRRQVEDIVIRSTPLVEQRAETEKQVQRRGQQQKAAALLALR